MDSEIFDKTSCSFCGKSKDKVKTLVAGPNGLYICDECVEICQDILKEDQAKIAPDSVNLLKPHIRKTMYISLNKY